MLTGISRWGTQINTTASGVPIDSMTSDISMLDFDSDAFGNEFDAHYGLLSPEQTVLVRAYSDDTDDTMLSELQPKFIVMVEPNMEFVRRVEARIH